MLKYSYYTCYYWKRIRLYCTTSEWKKGMWWVSSLSEVQWLF